MKTVDELLQTPCCIIDILPKQVPADSSGQYFSVDRYFLEPNRLAAIKQKHINVILKLNCYMDISLDDDAEINPAPEQIGQTMRDRHVNIRVRDALIISEPDDTHMTVFNADDELLELIRTLASAEGLYVWKPENSTEG